MKLLSTALAAVTLALIGSGSVSAETWKLSHVRPQGTAIDKDLNWFADGVKNATGGKVTMKIHAASALGDYTVVQERVSVGAVEMACQPAATAADKRFQIMFFPYLVANWDQAKRNFATGAPVRKVIDELYAKQGIRVLASWPVYFGGVALNKKPQNPGDPDAAKGLKVRVPPMKTFQLMADNIGFLGTPLPFSESFTAVQTGVVDGVVGSGAEGYYASFRDVTKYYMPINTHFEVWYLIVNDETFRGVDAATQKKIQDLALQFENRRWESAQADQAANEKKLADNGAEIISATPEQIAAMAKKVQAKVWPEILNDIGKDWGQGVLAKIAK